MKERTLLLQKKRLQFLNKSKPASELFEVGKSVSDVTPQEMFAKRLESMNETDVDNELRNAFQEIIEQLNL